jgi:hypothetical protein
MSSTKSIQKLISNVDRMQHEYGVLLSVTWMILKIRVVLSKSYSRLKLICPTESVDSERIRKYV